MQDVLSGEPGVSTETVRSEAASGEAAADAGVSARELAMAVFRHVDAWWATVDPFDKPYLGAPRLLTLLDDCGAAVLAGDVAATETACRAYCQALREAV